MSRQVSDSSKAQASVLEKLAQLEGDIATSRGREDEVPASEPEEPLDSEARVEAEHDKEEASSEDLTAAEEDENEEEAARQEKLDEALSVLFDPSVSWNDKEKVWGEVRNGDLIDLAIAAFEARAEESPQNPDLQADLGYAYLQKIDTVSEFERGTWALKADQTFDAALTLDESHWAARFMKATALSFWPPLFGKEGEAIRQFEILREQQEQGSPQQQFARTYVFLGNLYQNRGESEKAREIWAKGAHLFPENSELAARVQGPKKE